MIMILSLIVLACLGLIFGSFVNALVWRLRQQELNKQKNNPSIPNSQFSILNGRSQCVHCGHVLAVKDLVPILSWLVLRGRCRYCQQPISTQYPLVEIVCAAVFTSSYYFWPVHIVEGQWVLLVTWLIVAVGLLALAVYDLRFMILPNDIIYPTFAVAFSGRLIYILFFAQDKAHSFWLLALSLLVSSGIFWMLFMISSGRWIGYGDVRLGLISGTVLADPAQSLQMIFVASLLGTIAILPGLLSHRKSLNTKIPYGPFLILASFIVLLFGPSFSSWYMPLLT